MQNQTIAHAPYNPYGIMAQPVPEPGLQASITLFSVVALIVMAVLFYRRSRPKSGRIRALLLVTVGTLGAAACIRLIDMIASSFPDALGGHYGGHPSVAAAVAALLASVAVAFMLAVGAAAARR